MQTTTKPAEKVPTLLEIEIAIMTGPTGLMSAAEFTESLWLFLCRNKKAVRQYAKSLNVYPSLGNVYQAIKEYFTI